MAAQLGSKQQCLRQVFHQNIHCRLLNRGARAANVYMLREVAVYRLPLRGRAASIMLIAAARLLTPGRQTGLRCLLDTWMTPHVQYGDMLCFSSVRNFFLSMKLQNDCMD